MGDHSIPNGQPRRRPGPAWQRYTLSSIHNTLATIKQDIEPPCQQPLYGFRPIHRTITQDFRSKHHIIFTPSDKLWVYYAEKAGNFVYRVPECVDDLCKTYRYVKIVMPRLYTPTRLRMLRVAYLYASILGVGGRDPPFWAGSLKILQPVLHKNYVGKWIFSRKKRKIICK